MVWGKGTPVEEIVAALLEKFPQKEAKQPDPDEP